MADDISIHAYVVDELQKAKGTWPQVAEATGIALSTIKKIARKEVADPGVSLIERLASHFRHKQAA